jgi:uncharacterized protein involved in exopolysaccharide biosynthesis
LACEPILNALPSGNGHDAAQAQHVSRQGFPTNGSDPAAGRGLAAVRLLWDQHTLLLRLAVYGLIVSTAIAFLVPSYYRSSTRLMPPNIDPGMGLAALSALSRVGGSGLGMLAGNFMGFRSSGALFIGILRSRSVEDQLIDNFDLRKSYRVRRMEDARKQLEWNTDISEDRQSGIITITVTDHDPDRAAGMAKAYVEQLNSLLVQVNTSAAHKERLFIEDQLTKVKQDLDQASSQFSQFASNNAAIDIPEQGKAMVEAAARLQGELIAARSELSGLEQIYTANNVRIRSLRARTTELQGQLDKLGGTQSDSTPTTTADSSAYPSIRKLPLLGVKYFDLYRQTKMQEAVYEALNEEYAMAKVQEAKELPNARILDPADVPEKKAGPIRILIMFVGVVLFVAGAMLWILVRNRWQDIEPGDPRKQLVIEIGSAARSRMLQISSSKALLPIRKLVAKLSREAAPAA